MTNSNVDVFSVDFDKEKISNVELAVYGSGLLAIYPNVGGGEITNSYCDNFSGFYTCDRVDLHELIGKRLGKEYGKKVFVQKVHFNCGKWTCPACYRRVALREAGKVTTRLEAMSKLLKETSPESSEIEHVVVSLSPSDYGISDEKVLRAKAVKALKDLGIVDGGMMFHGSRHRRYEQIKGVVFRQIGTDWSCHYHLLGFVLGGYECRDCKRKNNCLAGCGKFDDRRWQYYKKTGIYVKVLPKRKSVFWTAAYQLNHISIKKDAKRVHTVTWIGSCSTRKLHIEVEKKKLVCPICGYELKRSIYVGKKYFATDRGSSDYVSCSLEDLEEDGLVVWIDAPKRSFVRDSVGEEPRYGSMEWLRSAKRRSGSYG